MSDPGDEDRRSRRERVAIQLAGFGASFQAAIPGIYAWALTVAPAAWSRGAPMAAKIAALVGALALATAPFVEATRIARVGSLAGASAARLWSVWGFVLSSATVWALAPAALSSARLDGIRGALGMVGWALFAFASAGPSLKPDPEIEERVVSARSLKPRSELPRGDGLYIGAGVAMALAMQAIGWRVVEPERAILVRLVTVASGIAVASAMTSIALARHLPRTSAPRALRMRRALPWVVVLAISMGVAVYLTVLVKR